jgi:ATP-dependent Clp protease ATP-binding subunit ClpC
VHLRAQTQQAAASGETAAVAAAVRTELQPMVRRIERLEERVGVVAEG